MEAKVRPSLTPRQPDRRLAFGDLLLTLAGTLDRREHVWLLRDALERRFDALFRVARHSCGVFGRRGRWTFPLVLGRSALVFNEPACFEPTFNPGAPLGGWDFQVLGLAAHVGALVLERLAGRREARRSLAASRGLALPGKLLDVAPVEQADAPLCFDCPQDADTLPAANRFRRDFE